MNELPSTPSSEPQPNAAFQSVPPIATVIDRDEGRARMVRRLTTAALVLLAILLAALWWSSHAQIASLRKEIAQRLQSGENSTNETRVLVKSVQEATRELQARLAVVEGKQVEAQSQQLALEQLYQELSRNRDDWALAEIEQVLSTASQQLQLAGNVRGALIALQNADARLSRSDKPQFIIIRRAIARDLEHLRALPVVDITGLALRLDSVIGQIDSMPLLSDEKPALPATQPKTARRAKAREAVQGGPAASGKTGANAAADWLAGLEDKWESWTNEMWTEVRQLIRVRNVETPDVLLLSPTQAYYARENLKLRLLNARLALLSRNESAFRSDLIAAQDTVAKYFDTRAKQTQTVQALLKQVQSSNFSIEMPTLAESLNAVRNYKAKP